MGDQTPEQATPEVVDRVQASFDRQGLMRLLGAHAHTSQRDGSRSTCRVVTR